jgi:hypothetical protein
MKSRSGLITPTSLDVEATSESPLKTHKHDVFSFTAVVFAFTAIVFAFTAVVFAIAIAASVVFLFAVASPSPLVTPPLSPCARRAVCRGCCVCNVLCDTGFNPNSMNAVRPKLGVAKNRTSIPNSFKTPIMGTACLQAPRTRLMTRKPTRFMTKLTD